MFTCRGLERHRLPVHEHPLASHTGSACVRSNGQLFTLAFTLSMTGLALLGGCTSDQQTDPHEISTTSIANARLRYSYPVGAEFVYRQSIERTHYGTTSGETHLLQLQCRESSRDVHTFTV